MLHAIRYRRLDGGTGLRVETLAVDISCRDTAERLVHRLAASYPSHGRYLTGMRWFRSGAGLHLIWVHSEP